MANAPGTEASTKTKISRLLQRWRRIFHQNRHGIESKHRYLYLNRFYCSNTMNQDSKTRNRPEKGEIVVKASSIDGILSVLDVEAEDRRDTTDDTNKDGENPDELASVVETLVDALDGLRAATREDPRGRSRKKVRAYADREDVPSDRFGHHLRVLEHHGLAECDGNRWRLAADAGTGRTSGTGNE